MTLFQVLLLYVLVYLVQWFPSIIFAWMYGLGLRPPYTLTFAVVIFINMGGLMNCIAYTFIRKKMLQVSSDRTTHEMSLQA